ncbi:hypothetical protein F5J12DRAFT_785531 [Pisolithus orientalis]|uniref:uncharacterized protein n=1 Tax=Pisolithus orientalis TaxID=936130 RepID=UPI002224683F|nr:uncharacterized protein F5J12DRAFT_785531 [Pisolithus orientalis]KAI5995749.1 hypothetical protein F5J12DRAFT_785531 [Pisolithus orientalis]
MAPSTAYDTFNSDAEDGGPEDFNLDEGTDNTDLEDLDSNTKQHRRLTHELHQTRKALFEANSQHSKQSRNMSSKSNSLITHIEQEAKKYLLLYHFFIIQSLFPAAPNPNTDQCNPAWWKSQDGKLKGTLTELYKMIPADLHKLMVTYKQFGSVVHVIPTLVTTNILICFKFIQVHGQERSNVPKVIKDCTGALFTPYNISPDLFTAKPARKKDSKACLALLKKDGVGEYPHFAPILFADPKQMVTGGFLKSPILVKVICVLMFGKLILTENKCGWPPARGQKMGVLSITEGLIAGACILVQFLLSHDPELSATGAEIQVNYRSEYDFYLKKLFKASPWAGSQLANVKSEVFANVEQPHTWEDEFLDKLNNIDPAESHTPPVSTLHDLNAPGGHDSDLCDSNLSLVSHTPSPVASSVTHFNPPHSHPASVTAAQADLSAQTISGASC